MEHQALTGAPRNDILLAARDQIIEHHFPQVNQNLVGLQQNQIATQLANLHATQLQHRQEDEQRRQDDKNDWDKNILVSCSDYHALKMNNN